VQWACQQEVGGEENQLFDFIVDFLELLNSEACIFTLLITPQLISPTNWHRMKNGTP